MVEFNVKSFQGKIYFIVLSIASWMLSIFKTLSLIAFYLYQNWILHLFRVSIESHQIASQRLTS
jgi:hypothetical protein